VIQGAPPLPACAVCRKLVDRMQWAHSVDGMRLMLRVECHGETESMDLPMRDLMGAAIQPGVAFAAKKIEEGQPA
jgi:hypothetical protein